MLPRTSRTARMIKLALETEVGKVDGCTVYASDEGLSVAGGGYEPAGTVYGYLTKGEARKIRKRCRQLGFIDHAAAQRQE